MEELLLFIIGSEDYCRKIVRGLGAASRKFVKPGAGEVFSPEKSVSDNFIINYFNDLDRNMKKQIPKSPELLIVDGELITDWEKYINMYIATNTLYWIVDLENADPVTQSRVRKLSEEMMRSDQPRVLPVQNIKEAAFTAWRKKKEIVRLYIKAGFF